MRIDVGPLYPNVTIEGPDQIDPCPVREPHHRKNAQRSRASSRQSVKARITRIPNELNDRPPWVVDQSEDQFGDAASILTKQAGNAA